VEEMPIESRLFWCILTAEEEDGTKMNNELLLSQRITNEVSLRLGTRALFVEHWSFYDPETDDSSPGIRVIIEHDADDTEIEEIITSVLSPYVIEAGSRIMNIPTFDIVRKVA
jgi:hypothetical protein